MRVQMRLSQESEFILRKEKENYKEKEDVSATYGWLVNKITKDVFSKDINKIDWKSVKSYQLKLVDEPQVNDCEYNTTLNLEKSVLENINTLQIMFKDVFNAARIHKAFVVRMLLKANFLINQNTNIFKEK
ncbi:hypothetical protein [Caproiciproducens sp. CPB-2]|uniref:hypothetical protein n=1 Tax=Caproiciproducens sp. CPB-2 TaxID=3030017 RepID=UPI0023DBB3B1|nr:hypothetical protein [Caproiciproducens sp. CPB-2]MDF1494978.1 hypothetical protein [Caproiciproducens sp. CPB-2]